MEIIKGINPSDPFDTRNVTKARHTYLHKRTMVAEGVAKTFFNPVTLPVRGGYASTSDCGCN